jgi:hypothetical protein
VRLDGNARRGGRAKGANKYFNSFNARPFLGERGQKLVLIAAFNPTLQESRRD